MTNNPAVYSKDIQLEHATIPDSIGNSFQPRYLPQQAPLGTSQYSASPMYPPKQITDDQRYETGLSRETIIRIDELKRLANKYPKYCPEGLMQWAIFCCNDGDNKILDDKLDQLRTIDKRLNGWASPLWKSIPAFVW
jgi:hypothetical protein